MNFIEFWLHVSPDGGNGSLESTIVLTVLLVLLVRLLAPNGAGLRFWAKRFAEDSTGRSWDARRL